MDAHGYALLRGLLLALVLSLSACRNGGPASAAAPPPVAEIPDDARGHYCGMYMFEHPGPKGQVLIRDEDKPIWFSTIREVFAFSIMPDEPKAILAIYVQDVAHLRPDGSFPPDAWIDARQASYLAGSDHLGNMGVPDVLPFGDEAAAQAFQQEHGGRLVAFDDMPEDLIFGTAAGTPPAARSTRTGATP